MDAGKPVERVVEEAVNECIDEDVLPDFFREHRSEVVEMGIYDFDQEVYERIIKEENWEMGREAGLAEGRTLTLIRLICRKLIKGKSIETIADELEEDPEVIRKICAVAEKYAPEYDAEKILAEYTSPI